MALQKLSSRQKMINMMYLVLIAMLVLNVDKRVLDAFHTMEVNNLGATAALNAKSLSQLDLLAQMVEKDPLKTKPYYERAQKAHELTEEFNAYIEGLKQEIVLMYGGRLEQEAGQSLITALKTPDQFEKHSNYFIVKDKGAKAKELQLKINHTRDALIALLAADQDSLFTNNSVQHSALTANQLNAEEPENKGVRKRTWAQIHLEEQPAGALLALLSQFQSSAKLLESEVINRLTAAVNSNDYKFDELKAAVLPTSDFVMQGDVYKAQVLLVARSSTLNPDIIVNGEKWNEVDKGIGMLQLPAQSIGKKEYSGTIKVLNPSTNEFDTFNFNRSYTVFKPVATIAPEAMNLFYVGLENPVSISVPGFTPDQIKVNISSGGSISGSNGNYMVKVNGNERMVRISVTADGNAMGSTAFRVRNVPPPSVRYGSIPNNGRGVRKEIAAAQTAVVATMGDDFAYNMGWKVTSYRYIYVHKTKEPNIGNVSGSAVPTELKNLLRGARKGDILIIQDIKARDTKYGIDKSLNPISLNLI